MGVMGVIPWLSHALSFLLGFEGPLFSWFFFSAGETTLFGVQREAELISDGEGEAHLRGRDFHSPSVFFFNR